MKRIFILLLIFTSFSAVFGQYGNDWINYSQTYIKFEINSEGIYRIEQQALIDAGLPISSIDPRSIRIYRDGREQYLWVQGEDDGVFDATDYIELYCTYNDGRLDEPLYGKKSQQTNPYVSLYTDSAAYFLTWSPGTNGLRYRLNSNTDYSSQTADSYFMYESVKFFQDQWLDGMPYSDLGYYSEYTLGEGYLSGNISNPRSFDILTPDYDSTGPSPTFKMLAFGESNPAVYDADGNNHEFEVQAVNGSLKEVLISHKHRGFQPIQYSNVNISKKLIGSASTRFQFASIFGAKGRHALGPISVTYPRKFKFNNLPLTFTLPPTNTYFKFTNYPTGKSQPIIYNLESGVRYTPTLTGSTLEFRTGTGETGTTYITDVANAKKITVFKTVSFQNYSSLPIDLDYLIISHSSLQTGAEQYAAYRKSAAGGNYNVALVYADQLYDEFYYGIHHPLALRNWIYYMINRQSTSPSYLLLLGKGQMYINIRFDPNNREKGDLVPTMGWPPSDYLFTSPLDASDLKPLLATGRIPANTNQEIQDYLSKVVEYEQNPITRKFVLQLAGGTTTSQNVSMENYLKDFASIIKQDSFGGNTLLISKRSTSVIDESLVEQITSEVNKGVNLVNYFGHGAAAVTEIDFGNVQSYQNKGKYPIYFFDGCILGNSFDRGEALLEEFLFEPQKGAIAWVAGSFYGYQAELYHITKEFHTNTFQRMYGQTIGQIMQQSIDDYQDIDDPYSVTHSRVMLLHGDPTIKMYSPPLPDYTSSPSELELDNSWESFDSIQVVCSLHNVGKVTYDTISVILQIVNSGNITLSDTLTISPFANSHKFTHRISKKRLLGGLNKLKLTIDPFNHIQELGPIGESNNVIERDQFIQLSRLDILTPEVDGIISSPEAVIKFTTYEVPTKLENFQIIMDTTPSYNSPLFYTNSLIHKEIVSTFRVPLAPIDSIDYYFTVINTSNNDSAHGTFTYIYKSPRGASQGYWSKFNASNFVDLYLDPSNRSYQFSRGVSSNIVLQTSGTGVRRGGGNQYDRALYYGNINFKPGLIVLAVNPDDESRYRENSKFNVISGYPWLPDDLYHEYYGLDSFSCLYRYNTNLKEERDSLISFLHRIPEGYYLGIYNETTTGINNWEEELFLTLEAFGATKIRTLIENHPYILWGRKGYSPGQAIELFANYDDNVTTPENQYLDFSTTIYPLKNIGEINSPAFGPASSWSRAVISLEGDNPSDSFVTTVFGYDSVGNPIQLLIGAGKAKELDLSSIDASLYPYLSLRLKLMDESNRTPMQLSRWTMLYTGLPEGIAYQEVIEKDTVDEGDPHSFNVVFLNVSDFDMDSLVLQTTHYHGLTKLSDQLDTLRKLPAGDSIHVTAHQAEMRYTGDNSTVLLFNPNRAQPEEIINNNVSARDIFVLPNKNTPILEVYFDQQQIMNGQIINPNAHISALGRSNHMNMLITSPDLYRIEIKKIGGGADNFYDSIYVFNEETSSSPSKFDFDLDNLEAGKYVFLATLISPTASENAREANYTIEFEISAKNEITELIPYPNPMVNQCRFAYTYGGRDIPSKYHLSIFNINGKLVREVDQDEFGPLGYGTQLSEFVFDGTDQFGDQLANGVYLYRFEIKDAEKKASALDNYFTAGYGKLYLAR
ncbi:MAG: hypothetical protein H6608_11790 [Flavobacteriales bacterium]|nr:hypothetical protein [Bacteroidota bacterium]MCB9241810.1 hypothetical protein [Flavobacteriales bacterium]